MDKVDEKFALAIEMLGAVFLRNDPKVGTLYRFAWDGRYFAISETDLRMLSAGKTLTAEIAVDYATPL